MEGRCSRYERCESYTRIGCSGCGFQHFENVLMAHPENDTLMSLGDDYFLECSTKRQRPGGRVSLDGPINRLFLRRIPKLKKMQIQALRVKLPIDGEEFSLEVKCDGALESGGIHIFYEIKGYGDNTNDILSAIMAAQVLREVLKYKNSIYYYIGISSAKGSNKGGLRRGHFLEEGRTKISPYVKWAESKGFLRFYGIVDIDVLLDEVKKIVHNHD